MNALEVIFGRDWLLAGEPVRIRSIVIPNRTRPAAPRAECVDAEGKFYYVMLHALEQAP